MSRLVDDLDTVVAAAAAALRQVAHLDWDVPASGLTRTCRSTLEHVADGFAAMGTVEVLRRPGSGLRAPAPPSAGGQEKSGPFSRDRLSS